MKKTSCKFCDLQLRCIAQKPSAYNSTCAKCKEKIIIVTFPPPTSTPFIFVLTPFVKNFRCPLKRRRGHYQVPMFSCLRCTPEGESHDP